MKQLVKKLTTKKTTVLNAEDGTSFILHEPQLIEFLSKGKKEVLEKYNNQAKIIKISDWEIVT
jgi:hypothetical protein